MVKNFFKFSLLVYVARASPLAHTRATQAGTHALHWAFHDKTVTTFPEFARHQPVALFNNSQRIRNGRRDLSAWCGRLV